MAKKYFIKDKEEITDLDAPVVSDEFVHQREEGEYRGQTIEVKSKTKLEEDLGTGEPLIFRSYAFASTLDMITNRPSDQQIFDSHLKGVSAMLWGDGLSPAVEIPPKLVFSDDRSKYLIMVWARPAVGQTVLETPQTLTQIIHGNRRRENRDTLQRSVPVSPTKKAKTSRTAKTSK